MRNQQTFTTVAIISLSPLAMFGTSVCRAGSVTYQVSADTSPLNGQDGNLDFQFNPGSSGAQPATATVTDFHTVGGILSQPAALTGDAAGSLPGTLTLNNGTIYNDIFQGFTYGESFSFLLTLSGEALDHPSGTFGSSFALSLYDAAGITPLLTTDPNGSVLTVNINADGTISAETFPHSPTNNTPAVLLSSAVPEPASLLLVVFALPLVLLISCRGIPAPGWLPVRGTGHCRSGYRGREKQTHDQRGRRLNCRFSSLPHRASS